MPDQFTISRKTKRQVKREIKKSQYTNRNATIRALHNNGDKLAAVSIRRWKNALH